MKTMFWFLALLLTLTLALGVLSIACGDDDDDDNNDDDNGGDDDDDTAVECEGTADCTEALGEGWVCVGGSCVDFSGDDDNVDDDAIDDDDDFTPADYCADEQHCWLQMGSSMGAADTPAKASAAYTAFYDCLNTANGCTGRYYDCVNDCNGNASCIETCSGAHFVCLTELCGWNGNCYSTCGADMNDCLNGCGELTNWTCLRGCYIDGAECIGECW